jgi:epoxyqueuosine reductase
LSDARLTLSGAAVRRAAMDCRFTLVGLARAEPLPAEPIRRWLEAGYAADMDWMASRLPERLDPGQVLPGAATVIALGIAYRRPADERARSAVASYARGRDYHYAHRDRMKALRRRLLALAPGVETYACVDTGAAMEKVWAERAGLGWIGKNGCLINPRLGSWVTLSVMFVDRAVDEYDSPQANLCGDCVRCLRACPTRAFPEPGVVDARRCLAYQSIENRDVVPLPLRRGFKQRVFGCDVCQEVCPFNRDDIPVGDARFEPRAIATLSPAELAALSRDEFERLSAGTALARAQYDGVRRNALLAIGAARQAEARPVVERLAGDGSPIVRGAAEWALQRIAVPPPGQAPAGAPRPPGSPASPRSDGSTGSPTDL